MAENKYAALLSDPAVTTAALGLIDMVMGIVNRRNQGEITEAQALDAFDAAAGSVNGAFADWHAAKQPGEG